MIKGLLAARYADTTMLKNHWMNVKELRQHNGTRMHMDSRRTRKARAKPKCTPVEHTSANAQGDADPQIEATGWSAHYQNNFADTSNKHHSPGTDTRASPTFEGPEISDNKPLEGTNGDHDRTAQDLSWLDAMGSRAQFSAGDENPDSMAESLARALHNAGIGGTDGQLGGDEHPLHKEDEVYGADEDPFYCKGIDSSISTPSLLTKSILTGPELNTKSCKDLMTEWFGDGEGGLWFPYPDKAVSSAYHFSRIILICYEHLAISDRPLIQFTQASILTSTAESNAAMGKRDGGLGCSKL